MTLGMDDNFFHRRKKKTLFLIKRKINNEYAKTKFLITRNDDGLERECSKYGSRSSIDNSNLIPEK
jgi:hypothetical protein